jgi:hypothetical protein
MGATSRSRLPPARHPEAKGHLRDPAGYRLYDRREELIGKLLAPVRAEEERIPGRVRQASTWSPLRVLVPLSGAVPLGRLT